LNDAQKELFQVFFIGKENKAKKETTIYKRKSPGQILRNSILSK
jgi:hypothetical protein